MYEVPIRLPIEALSPWVGVGLGIETQKLKLRLKKAVPVGHELYGKYAVPVAQREDTGQVLFLVQGLIGGEVAVVWFPEDGEPNGNLKVDYYKSMGHWSRKCERPDHRALVGPSPRVDEAIRSLSGMYDGTEPGWVLVDLGQDEYGDEGEKAFCPTNYLTHMDNLICDDDVYDAVKKRMLEAGVQVVNVDELRKLEIEHQSG